MDKFDRMAECNRQANDYLERAKRAAAGGSPVAAREWLAAAEAAMDAATAAAPPPKLTCALDETLAGR